MWTEIINAIIQHTSSHFELINYRSIGGGCINQAYELKGKNISYFVKLNSITQVQMFEAESLGLEQMHNTDTIVVPKPICYGITNNNSYLVLEYLNLGDGDTRSGSGAVRSWQLMGQKLALLHQTKVEKPFGWYINNTIVRFVLAKV